MNFELDFLPVGNGEKSGDAICMRIWNEHSQRVFVIDGGTKDSGEALVKHIKEYYVTEKVDAVFLTHPDADHASGLTEVLENLTVDNLVMHEPWNLAGEIKSHFEHKSITNLGIQKKIKEGLQFAHDLKKIATNKNITITEPYAGVTGYDGMVHILGPSAEYYKNLIPQFRCTPEPKE